MIRIVVRDYITVGIHAHVLYLPDKRDSFAEQLQTQQNCYHHVSSVTKTCSSCKYYVLPIAAEGEAAQNTRALEVPSCAGTKPCGNQRSPEPTP